MRPELLTTGNPHWLFWPSLGPGPETIPRADQAHSSVRAAGEGDTLVHAPELEGRGPDRKQVAARRVVDHRVVCGLRMVRRPRRKIYRVVWIGPLPVFGEALLACDYSHVLRPSFRDLGVQHQVGGTFGYHHGGHVGIGPDAVRHDRRVYDPQAVYPVDLPPLVDHGQMVRLGTHLAGA